MSAILLVILEIAGTRTAWAGDFMRFAARVKVTAAWWAESSSTPGHAERFFKIGQTQRRLTPRVGRNDPCRCGSGRKFKKCCA